MVSVVVAVCDFKICIDWFDAFFFSEKGCTCFDVTNDIISVSIVLKSVQRKDKVKRVAFVFQPFWSFVFYISLILFRSLFLQSSVCYSVQSIRGLSAVLRSLVNVGYSRVSSVHVADRWSPGRRVVGRSMPWNLHTRFTRC